MDTWEKVRLILSLTHSKFISNILIISFNAFTSQKPFLKSFRITFFLAGPIPLRVREAQIPIVNDNECVRKINAVTEKIFILPASSFCAGGEEGHDACQVKKFVH